jgi:hypothetical protein
MLLTHEC